MQDLDESYPCGCHFVRTGNSHHVERCAEGQRLWQFFRSVNRFCFEGEDLPVTAVLLEAEREYYAHTGRSAPGITLGKDG